MPALMRKTLLVVFACALALAASACGGGGAEKKTSADVPPDAIAVVGDQAISKAEFQRLMDRARKNYELQKRPFPKPGTAEYNNLKNQAVVYLVQKAEYEQEAKSLGVTVTDAEVQKRLDEIKKAQYGGSEAKLAADLKKNGLTLEQAKDLLRYRLIQEGIYKKVSSNAKVTDAEVRNYYEHNKTQFGQPATRAVRHILVKSKARADEIYAQLKSGADFAQLAKKFSQDTGTKSAGGKYTASKGNDAPEFDKVAFALKTGEISKPVKTQFGWHIIEALGPVKPAKATPFENVKQSIRQQLITQKRSNALSMWQKSLEQRYKNQIAYAVGYKPPKSATSGAPAQ
jgi:parvulin-like peptidyl-prolyl isomerase